MLSQKVMLVISLSVLVVCLVLSLFNIIFLAPVIFSLWSLHEQRDRIHERESDKELEVEQAIRDIQRNLSSVNAELTLVKEENRSISTKLAFSNLRL